MKKSNPMRLLEQAGIPFEAYAYESDAGRLSGVEVAQSLNLPVAQVCKTLVTVSPGKDSFVFVIPVGEELSLKSAARAVKAESLTMLPQTKLFPLTGYVHGGCSPLGMKKTLPTVFEETLADFAWIGVNGGRVGLMLKLDPKTLSAFIFNSSFASVVKK